MSSDPTEGGKKQRKNLINKISNKLKQDINKKIAMTIWLRIRDYGKEPNRNLDMKIHLKAWEARMRNPRGGCQNQKTKLL